MSEVSQPVGKSPSKGINDNAQKNWEGGVRHGSKGGSTVLSESPTKHPLPANYQGQPGGGKTNGVKTKGRQSAVEGGVGPAGSPMGERASRTQYEGGLGPAGQPSGMKNNPQKGKVSWWPGKNN